MENDRKIINSQLSIINCFFMTFGEQLPVVGQHILRHTALDQGRGSGAERNVAVVCHIDLSEFGRAVLRSMGDKKLRIEN
jgi:hypothetical protein